MDFLKILLWVLVGYYILLLLTKWLGPRIRSYAARKAESYIRERFGNQMQNDADNHKVGEVSIDKKPSKKRRSGQPVGEYIEYEEIE